MVRGRWRGDRRIEKRRRRVLKGVQASKRLGVREGGERKQEREMADNKKQQATLATASGTKAPNTVREGAKRQPAQMRACVKRVGYDFGPLALDPAGP